ncbi:serine hydrolase [Pendulispora albinea]|uniref:beta-lactamase n=1 Tax=Pendulispora albinea TaxID=2741071 RepID=A0ABZ2LTR4_9BACT
MRVIFGGSVVVLLGSLALVACSSSGSEEDSSGAGGVISPLSLETLESSTGADRGGRCPSGIGDHWVCSGKARVRCVDGAIQREHCSSGCNDPAGEVTEAVCTCPAPAGTRWACSEDGNLHSCNGGGWMTQECHCDGCTGSPANVSASCNARSGALQAVLDKLGPQCGQYSPGTYCSLSVRDLVTGETASYRGNAFEAPASTVKALWVAAALLDVGIEKVKPLAEPVFIDSDNSAAGQVIDLLVSPDRVNTFAWHDIGVADIGFCRWNYDKVREAGNCDRGPRGGSNFITTDDAVRFLTAVWNRRLLGKERSRQLLDWMKLSPRQGYGGWLGTQLPPAARATMHHKAGWLPPAEVPGNSNSNEIGIVEVPNGHPYAVALLLNGAPSQEAYDQVQLPTLEYASCVIYHAAAKDHADPFAACVHP